MSFGLIVPALGLLVLVSLVAGLILFISGKGATRWVGLSLVLLVLIGVGALFIGAAGMRVSSTPPTGLPGESFKPLVPGGDHSYWFQSRMFGSGGSMEFFQEFAIAEGTTTSEVRATVQAALFEVLGSDDAHGLEAVEVDLRFWRAEADGPEAWKLTATEDEVSWAPSDSLDLLPLPPGTDPGSATPTPETPSAESTGSATSDAPSANPSDAESGD